MDEDLKVDSKVDSKEDSKDEIDPVFALPFMGNINSDPMRMGFAIPFGLNGEVIKDNKDEEEDPLRK